MPVTSSAEDTVVDDTTIKISIPQDDVVNVLTINTLTTPQSHSENEQAVECYPDDNSYHDIEEEQELNEVEGGEIHEVEEEEIHEVEDEEKKKARKEEEALLEKERQEKRHKQRIHVMREILSTEQTYVDWLKVLDQEFMKPLKASIEKGGSEALLAPNEYQNMFMDIEVVVRVNQELLKSLKEFFRHNGLLNDGQQPEEGTRNLSLGDIFLKMTPYLKSYTSYINKYEGIFKFIEEKKEAKKKFRKWLERTESQPATLHQQLLSFMILPVQRIPRYNLLLRELIGNMDEDQVDYDKLVKANNDIKDVATRVNERLREQNAQERLVVLSEQNVIEGLNFELLRAARKLLHEGVLGYVSSAGIKHRTVFLFSDLILSVIPIAESTTESNGTGNSSTENGETSSPLITKERFKMRSAISFLSTPLVWINDLPDGFVLHNAFQIVTEHKVWTFFAPTFDEKKEWISKITKAIELVAKHNPTLQNVANAELYAPPPSSKLNSFLPPEVLARMKPYTENPSITIRTPSPTAETKTPRKEREGSFHKFLNKLQVKQKKKGVELNQLTGTIESDDEEEERTEMLPSIPLKPWMDECNKRLVEKQRHIQLVNILSKEKVEVAPLLDELVNDDYELVQNPLFGLKGPTRQSVGSWRASIETDLKDKHKETEADFNTFISTFKGNISAGTSSSLSPESTQQKRKSRFFFL